MDIQTIGILICTLLIPSLSLALQADTTSYQLKPDELKDYYQKSFDNPDSLMYRKLFFDTFPDSFHELDALYGYHDQKKESLYDQGPDHIMNLFNKMDCIKDSVYYRKLINISFEGHWDADAINYFQLGLHQHSLAKPKLLFALLSSYSNKKIQSFFHFFYDGVHPPFETIPTAFKRIKPKYPRTYQQMKKAFKSTLSAIGHK